MAAFEFELVSPEKLLFSGEVDAVTASGTEGDFTVMKDHAPFMTTLRPGWVRIQTGGQEKALYVRGGFADVAPSGFTILADYAVSEADLTASVLDKDIEAAEKAFEEARGDEHKRLALEQRDHLREFKATANK